MADISCYYHFIRRIKLATLYALFIDFFPRSLSDAVTRPIDRKWPTLFSTLIRRYMADVDVVEKFRALVFLSNDNLGALFTKRFRITGIA